MYVILLALAGRFKVAACIPKTYVQTWRFDAEFCEGIPEVLLGNCELRELTGERLSQIGHIFIALSVVFEQLEAGLQV